MTDWLGKIIGRVRIEKLLARGGMAEVYLGTHLTLERQVAIKLLQSHIEEDPDLLERLHREAKVVAGLRHPNIVQIIDFDTVDGHPYIVMEYLRGPTLANYLRGLNEHHERIPYPPVVRLLKTLTAALDYAHILQLELVQSLFHSGKLSTRAKGLMQVEGIGTLRINPRDAARYGLQNGAWVRLSNAHGELTIPVKVLGRVPQGQAWFPDHFGTEAMRLFHCAVNPVTSTPSIRITSVSVIKVA